MRLIQIAKSLSFSKALTCNRSYVAWVLVLSLGLFLTGGVCAFAQGQGAATPTPTPAQQPNATGEAGGPQGDIGPIAVPKKKEEPPKKEDVPKEPQKVEGMPNFSMRVSVPLVTLDVGVLTKDGMFVPGLKKENFRVLEDGVPQTVTSFNQTEAPITAVMLVEFANNDFFYAFAYDSLVASYTFAQTLKKEDWIAMITYDMRTRILQDFTQDKRAIMASVSMVQPGMAMSSETNLFERALYQVVRAGLAARSARQQLESRDCSGGADSMRRRCRRHVSRHFSRWT